MAQVPTRHQHDPEAFATGLGGRLASRTRHVCVLLGAGAGKACGLPDVKELQEKVLRALPEPDREMFNRQLRGRNLEDALSRLRRIHTLVQGEDRVDGLSGSEAEALDAKVCQAVVRALDLKDADLSPMRSIAAWLGRADYHTPVDLFTVNYDLLIETALEELGVPYFDGFIGAIRARFQIPLVEEWADEDSVSQLPSQFVRLWKLHGSVNWEWGGEGGGEVVRTGRPVPTGQAAAIYPSDAKYVESRRVPFVVLHDRLRRALHKPETLVILAGYSFSDQHINEVLFDAATRRQRSEFIAFCYETIPEQLAERAVNSPNLQAVSASEAILSGTRAAWRVLDNERPDLWADGRFALHDFRYLAAYLGKSVAGASESTVDLSELISRFGIVSAGPEQRHTVPTTPVAPEARPDV